MQQQDIDTKSRLGQLLLDKGLLNQSQLKLGLTHGKMNQLRLGEALEDLGFVSAKDIRKALKKQNIYRKAATSLLLLLAPFQSISSFAASQGSMGNQSSASANISVTIPPKVQISGIDDIRFNINNTTQLTPKLIQSTSNEDEICIRGNGISAYHITAYGSGMNNDFSLSNDNGDKLSYDVDFFNGTSVKPLTVGIASAGHSLLTNAPDCDGKNNAAIKLNIPDVDLNKASTNHYSGVLTLTISAE